MKDLVTGKQFSLGQSGKKTSSVTSVTLHMPSIIHHGVLASIPVTSLPQTHAQASATIKVTSRQSQTVHFD